MQSGETGQQDTQLMAQTLTNLLQVVEKLSPAKESTSQQTMSQNAAGSSAATPMG